MSDLLLSPGSHTLSLEYGDRRRFALVHVPPRLSTPLRVVLAFHGAGSSAAAMVEFCGLNAKADEAGFIAVYPNGTGRSDDAATWNGGPHCGYAGRHQVDDVGFVRAFVETFAERYVSGRAPQWFATGMSNGGLMCYRLAEELSDIFPAIAPVAAAMGKPHCAPRLPVSVVHLHGLEDEFVPYAGGIGKRSLTRTPFISVTESIEAWVVANGCDPSPHCSHLPPAIDDGTCVECVEYVGGRMSTRVVLYRILGGGHTWPGVPTSYGFLGPTTGNLGANDVIWDFFTHSARRA